jgi:hypothetical protein
MPKNKKTKSVKPFSLFAAMSPAKGMLLFAIVFAVLGGSYLAYSSFAATLSTVHGYNEITSPNGATLVKDPNYSSKGENYVWKLTGGQTVASKFKFTPKQSLVNVKACINVRKPQNNLPPINWTVLLAIGSQNKGGAEGVNVYPSSTYSKVCTTGSASFAGGQTYDLEVGAQFSTSNVGEQLYIASISIEWFEP